MIACPITRLPLEKLYKYVYRTVKDKLDNDQVFDVNEFMDEFFAKSVKNSDRENAAKWMQSLPRIINMIVSDSFTNKINLIKGMDNIYQMMNDYSKPGSEGINNVLDKYKEEVPEDLSATTAQQTRLEFSTEEVEDPEEEEKTTSPSTLNRLKTSNVMSGTFSAFMPVKPSEKTDTYVEKLDEPRARIITNLTTLSNAFYMVDPFTVFKYQNKTIKVKATNLYAFAQTNASDLDPTTQKEINESDILVGKGVNLSSVTQSDKRVIMLITDQFGDVLYFDENGNITDKPNGKPVYQFMRDVRKTPTGYTVTDIYGIEEQMMPVDTYAKLTYDEDIDGDYNTYLSEVKDNREKELKKLFNTREKALKEDVLLDFNGISTGVSSDLTATKIPLSDFMKIPGAEKKSLKSIKTLKKAKGKFKKGRAIINLNESEFQVNRSTMPDEIADQIAAVMFDANVPFETKMEFYSQFIPEDATTKMAYTMRKHEIIPDMVNKTFKINIYDQVGSDNGFLTEPKFKIPISEKVLSKSTPEQIATGIKTFSDALKQGQKNNKATFITYKSDLLNTEDYLTYDTKTKQFVLKNYIDFITSLDGQIDIIDADPGFYNKHLLFGEPTEMSKKIEESSTPILSFEEALALASAEADERRSPIEREVLRILDNGLSEEYKDVVRAQGYNAKSDNYFITSYVTNQLTNNTNLYNNESANELVNALSSGRYIGKKQADLLRDIITRLYPTGNTEAIKQIEVIQKTIEPEMPDPTIGTAPETKSLLSRLPKKFSLDRAGYIADEIGEEDTVKVLDWWNNTKLGKDLQKHIELEHAYNLTNSDVFAKFIVSGSRLSNPDILGKIQINKDKGTLVDIYHEAWHAFSQLYLTRKEKYALYNEVINYKDTSGNQPYKSMDYKSVDELLAEDFRTYMKKNYIKKGSPMRNKLFRKIMNFLRSLFGIKPINHTEVVTDVMNVPAVREMFEKLNYSSNNKAFLRSYKANIQNVDFFELDRGIAKINKPSDSALSKLDSDAISNTMDSIISSTIDKIYEERIAAGETEGVRSGTTEMLLDPEYRAFTYEEVKDELTNALKNFKNKLHKAPGVVSFSNIEKLESSDLKKPSIKSEAVAVLTDDLGGKKYVFLQSQMDGFENLEPNLKKGTRIRGESWHGIKIVGDFYTHKSIIENEKPVEIIVVSNIEDAQIQFDNYVTGGAKKYTGEKASVEVKDVPEYSLTPEQEFLLDNVRILQAALDNYGDPQWDAKGEKPTGTIAYHLENSDFEIASTKYYLDKEDLDENGEEIDEDKENETHDSETSFESSRAGKRSILQLASKEVVYALKSLHKVNREGEASYDRFGFKEKADFRKTWGIVSKTIGGVKDRAEAFDKLKAESKNFPELAQLIEFKFPDPRKIKSMFEVGLSNSFFQTFARPSIKYWQFTVFPQYESVADSFGNITEVISGFESDVTESSLAVDSTIRKFEALFKSSNPGEYIKKNDFNQAVLDVAATVSGFEDTKNRGQLDINKSMAFAAALGIKLDKLPAIESGLEERSEYYGLPYIYDIVKDFNDIKNNINATAIQRDYYSKFISNPVETLRGEIPKGILKSFKKEVAEKNILKRIAELQIKYGYENANPAVLLPDGNTVYENVNHSTTTVKVDAINSVNKLSDLWTDTTFQYMSHLKPGSSFFTLRSKVLGAIFDMTSENEDFDRKGNRMLQLLMTAGTQYAGIEGFNTADLDKTGKFFQEMHTFLLGGVAEFIRHAEKKSAFGIKQLGGKLKIIVNGITNGVDNNLYIDANKFKSKNGALTDGEIVAVGGYFLDYLAVEFDRIRYFKQNPNDLLTIEGYNRKITTTKSGKIVRAGELFTVFDNILTKATQAKLYKLTSDPVIDLPTHIRNNQDLFLDIQKDITNYFREKADSLYTNEFSKFNYIDPKVHEKVGYSMINPTNKEQADRDAITSYVYNDWIHKFEMFNLINGDAAQFDHDKEGVAKRASGSASDGDAMLNDMYMHKFINDNFNKKTYAQKLAKETNQDLDKFRMDGTLNTGVIADAKRSSIYLDDMLDGWEEKYRKDLSSIITDPKKLEQEIKRRLAKDAKTYKEMTESDGAAVITFDAYRTLRFMNNKWSTAQEALYQQIINGEEIDSTKIKEFFPVYKLQHYGPLANAPIATTAMYKFAVAPIIPTVAIPGTEMYNLHVKMLKSNLQLLPFKSGSKLASLTTNGETDNIFEPGSQDKAISADAPIRLNKIYLDYLKDVTAVATKLKKEMNDPTQKRVLLLDGLFNVGEIINSANKDIVNGYKSAVDNHTEILSAELLNTIGYEYNSKTGEYTGNLDKFIELIREELGTKEIPEQLITLLDTSVTGNLSMDFSIHPKADLLEKIIVNRIQKSVIKQKTKGEALVQAPSTFYNGVWDSAFQKDEAIKKNDALIKKYLGTNNLPFYTTSKDEDGNRLATGDMKVALALNGDFLNLLNLKHPDGEKIGTRDRLNVLIKNDDWLKENGELISIAGPRIPTDAANSMEFAQVWHFLDASFGNTVIVPTEIVAKAGSDFDVDKIYFMLPHIKSNGTLPSRPAESIEELNALVKQANKATKKQRKEKDFRSATSLITEYKRYSQNQLIKSTKEILSLPDNYASLTKANNTYLIEDEVEFYDKYATGYNSKKNVHGEPVRRNFDNDKDVMSPSRIFDIDYNLNKHEEMLSGNLPLGILAKKNKVHTLFKSVGAVMPATYKATVWNDETKKYDELDATYDMVMPIKHKTTLNKDGVSVISLSNENNIDGEKIGDILSHGLQGVLDRANNPFPFKLKIIKEALPTINHLIEAGASVPEVFAFVNNPWIGMYIDNQILLGGSTSKLLTENVPSSQVKSFAARTTINNMILAGGSEFKKLIAQLANYANDKRLQDITNQLKKNDPSKEYIFNLIVDGAITKLQKATGKELFFNKDFSLSKIYSLSEYDPKVSINEQKALYKRSSGITNNDNYYYAAQAVWKDAFGNENTQLSEKELKDLVKGGLNPTVENLAVLMRMIQLEKQFSGMDALEMAFSPDTGLLDTVLQIKKRDNALKMLSEVSKVDSDFLDRLRNNSILSSFYKSDMILKLTEPLFALRLEKSISDYIDRTITKNKETIAQRYGAGIVGQERFTNMYNNAVVNYIYQNTMSNFTDENEQPVLLPESIHSLPINKVTTGPAVKLTEKGFNVNVNKAEEDYLSKVFLSNNTTPEAFAQTNQDAFLVSENPFSTFASYLKFIVEKEYLYDVYKTDSEKENFEQFITEQALMKSFNRAYIMGTTKYSYTDLVMNTISEFEDQNIKINYPVLQQLSPARFEKDVNVFELNDKATAKGDIALEYYKNLKQLADPSVRKVRSSNKAKEKADNKKISDVFKDFSLMAYYQHGIGYSKLGFVDILDPEGRTKIMENASASFIANNISEDTLNIIYNKLVANKSNFKNYLSNPSDYTAPVKTEQEIIDDIIGDNWEAFSDFLEKPEGLEQPTQPVTNVKVISEDYGVVQAETNPSKEETQKFVDLIKPQIQAQTYKENKGTFANEMFHYGLMWARNNPKANPVKIQKFEGTNNNYYNYHALDQKGNQLPSIDVLQPIIDKIQNSLGIDMSDYDSVIGNIYLDNQYVYPHKDTTESITARNYPVVVYTIGNDSGLGIVDNNEGGMTFANNYNTIYLPSGDKLKGYTNEVLTQNGSIYTFGMDGNGRFELTHSTPTNSKKTGIYPPITLPNGKVITNYTITLTFRRAADLEPGMPIAPAKLTIVQSTQPSTQVLSNVQVESKYYNIALLKANPDKIYVFGDNITESGKGGQAIIRDEENAFGIPTKVSPNTYEKAYFNDNTYESNISQIDRAIEKIKADGRVVVLPKDGLGTGLAKMQEKAPDTYQYLKQRLLEEFGFDNDSGTLSTQPTEPSNAVGTTELSTFINYHGGAKKYDTYWEQEGKSFGVTKHVVYTVDSYDELDQVTKNKLEARYTDARAWLNRPNISKDSYAGKLVRRDMMQAAKADAIFAISEIVAPNTKGRKGYINKTNHPIIEGGTGYAVASGITLNKPVYIFNQDSNYGYDTGWYKWDPSLNDFVKTDVPVLTKNYAGIGSSTNETEIGRQAIRDVYENTLSQSTTQSPTTEGDEISTSLDNESDLTNSMRIYAETVKANKGVKPKMFMANNFTWSLNQNDLYNLLDKVTGFTFLKNVDLETGNIVPEPVSESAPVSEQKVNKMFKQIAAMIKNEHIADLLAVQGIDTRDIYEQLRDAETEADLNKINQTLLKALC